MHADTIRMQDGMEGRVREDVKEDRRTGRSGYEGEK